MQEPMKDQYLFGPEILNAQLAPVLAGEVVSLDDLQLGAGELLALGFVVQDGRVSLPQGLERLDKEKIQAQLSDRALGWLTDLQTLEIVGSTNTLVNDLAASGGLHGVVRLAELQIQGRGRRGRDWISPYGQNLALSVGMNLSGRPDRLGGFSLCVGLAVADCLQTLGVSGVELKWPNDVLVDGRKIAGILVEIHNAGDSTGVVVGIGINFRLSAEVRAGIDQAVVDLDELGGGYSRNQMAAGLISSLVDFIGGFDQTGFAPMQAAFNGLHRFHGEQCALLLADKRLTGRVQGVSTGGELLLEVDGRVQAYGAGEVSLRGI